MIRIVSEEEARRITLFSDNLRYLIRVNRTSVTALAKKLGLKQPTLNEYVRGRTMPNDEVIKQIAEALECSVDDLFDETYAPWKFGTGDEY